LACPVYSLASAIHCNGLQSTDSFDMKSILVCYGKVLYCRRFWINFDAVFHIEFVEGLSTSLSYRHGTVLKNYFKNMFGNSTIQVICRWR